MISAEEREAHWKRHLQSQYVDYEAFDRNLSDKVSISRTDPVAQVPRPVTSTKENKEKKAKKEKKEKKADRNETVVAPKRVTVLGARAGSQVAQDAAADKEPEPAAEEAQAVETAAQAEPADEQVEVIRHVGELRWPDLCTNIRRLLQKHGRTPAAELAQRWEEHYRYPLAFPLFGIKDHSELARELQPGSLVVVTKNGTILQASSDNAFSKEQARWKNAEDPAEMKLTATEWVVARLEQELKAARQSLKERRMAEKAALAQVEPRRQEYKALQANQRGGKSAQLKSTKLDLDKAEQKMQRFASEAQEHEAQERKLLARIAEVRKAHDEASRQHEESDRRAAANESEHPAQATSTSPSAATSEPEAGASSPPQAEEHRAEVGTSSHASALEEDFM